jgi:hypothetical protein
VILIVKHTPLCLHTKQNPVCWSKAILCMYIV